jgi:hypothetical protein
MKRLLMVASLLIPAAFAGGYMLATDNAWVTCMHQVEPERTGVPAVCADISSTGISTGLFFGIVGLAVWGIIWVVFARLSTSPKA